MNVVGALQGNKTRKRTRAGVFMVTLGLTASLIASPTVKREIAAKTDSSKVNAAGSITAKRHWFQIGKASWYGGSFNGRTTANGEKFDMNSLTCAHRTLPLGSWIRVTNLNNRKSAILRVNDRGPMAASLIVDLSYAAAQRLGFDGLAKVRIEPFMPVDRYHVDPKAAEELVAQLPMRNDPAVMVPEGEKPAIELMEPLR